MRDNEVFDGAARDHQPKSKNSTIMFGTKHKIKSVKKLILVAAGKGGVGKSTLSVLLAKQLQAKGHKVGILDADIYGPSIPTILNVTDKPLQTENNNFIPIDAFGISIMSIGFLLEPKSALVWRGPMLSKALNQLLFSTNWKDLDYLIVDMPPGTGDVHISIIQKCEIDCAIIVTTPDKIAIADVERAIDLYRKTDVPVHGIIENMSYIISSGKKFELFGSGGADLIAANTGLRVLAKLPLIPDLANTESYNLKELQIPLEF